MKKISPLIERHREEIKALAKKRGLANVRVYGSMSRNEDTARSDIDLLVDMDENQSLIALGGFLTEVSRLVNRKVDVATEDTLHPKMKSRILDDCVML